MSIENHPTNTTEEQMMYAAERIGSLLARYGQAFTVHDGLWTLADADTQTDVLIGVLRAERALSPLDVTYHVTPDPETPERLLTFTKLTDYRPAPAVESPGSHRARFSLFGRENSRRARLDRLTAMKASLDTSQPVTVKPPKPYPALYVVDREGGLTAFRLPKQKRLPLDAKEKQNILSELSNAQPDL
jgi:hypothetical protein